MNKTRFEAFSDGVFAFAITLLVLSFALPLAANGSKLSGEALTARLLELWPNLLAYGLSFAVIGLMWQNHHALFRAVARVDRTTVFLNLLLLGSTVFIPFASATLGAYPTTHAATFLYGLVLSACATSYNVMLMHLVRTRSFAESVAEGRIRATMTAYRVGWVVYACAAMVALLSPVVSFALYLIVVAYYVIPRGVDDDLERSSGS